MGHFSITEFFLEDPTFCLDTLAVRQVCCKLNVLLQALHIVR